MKTSRRRSARTSWTRNGFLDRGQPSKKNSSLFINPKSISTVIPLHFSPRWCSYNLIMYTSTLTVNDWQTESLTQTKNAPALKNRRLTWIFSRFNTETASFDCFDGSERIETDAKYYILSYPLWLCLTRLPLLAAFSCIPSLPLRFQHTFLPFPAYPFWSRGHCLLLSPTKRTPLIHNLTPFQAGRIHYVAWWGVDIWKRKVGGGGADSRRFCLWEWPVNWEWGRVRGIDTTSKIYRYIVHEVYLVRTYVHTSWYVNMYVCMCVDVYMYVFSRCSCSCSCTYTV